MNTVDVLKYGHHTVQQAVHNLPDSAWEKAGAYALDDFIVYAFYGHKREHCGQIALFRDSV